MPNTQPRETATAASRKTAAPKLTDAERAARFAETFATLRGVLERHGKKLLNTVNEPTDFQIASPILNDRTGRPLFVAAVQTKKNYVSFHLMPVYAAPALLKELSPALRKRMQGKACFNFTSIEADQLKELSDLTKKGIDSLKDLKLPWATAVK